MYVSTEDMKTCIDEWFSQALGFEDLREIYTVVRSESDKQFVYMADTIAKERARDGQYND